MAALRADRSMQLSLHFPQSDDSLHVAFLNTRSLHKHIDLIRHDQVLSASHINLYCETRVADTDSSDTYRVNSFQAIMYPSTSQSMCTPVPHRVWSSSLLQTTCTAVLSTSVTRQFLWHSWVHTGASCSSAICYSVSCVGISTPSIRFKPFHIHNSHVIVVRAAHCLTSWPVGCHTSHTDHGRLQHWLVRSVSTTKNDAMFPGYRQLVSEVTTDYASALDHVYTTNPAGDIQCYTGESYFSDHKPVTASIQFQKHWILLIRIFHLQCSCYNTAAAVSV